MERSQPVFAAAACRQPQLIDALRERGRANRLALRELDTSEADYAVTLDNLAAEHGRLATERIMLMGRVRAQIAAELTEEQRVEAERLMKRTRERAGRRFHRRLGSEEL